MGGELEAAAPEAEADALAEEAADEAAWVPEATALEAAEVAEATAEETSEATDDTSTSDEFRKGIYQLRQLRWLH